ncbi:MAG: type II secretion system protein GspG [Phycisphaerae bacterium]
MKIRETRLQGFTLIEVLLVIGILLVLGTVAVVGYSKIKTNADKDAARALVDQTCHAIDIYQIKMGVYPETQDGLKALTTPPADETLAQKWNANAPFLKDNKVPVDPWGRELKYEKMEATGGTGSAAVLTGPPYHVWSTGPSGQDGGDDNIRNWDPNATQ